MDASAEEYARLSSLIAKQVEELGEHFDGLLILATYSDGQGTKRIFQGSGNWFTRKGMAQDYIEAWRDKDQAIAIASEITQS